MGLVAEYAIPCGGLPLVDVAAAVPDATVEIEIQFNHGARPPFLVHATHDDHAPIERAFESSAFVDRYALVGQAGETRRYQVRPAVGMEAQLGDHLADLDAWLDDWPVWPAPVDHVENTSRMNRALEAHPLPETLDVDAPVLLLTGSEGPPHLRESVRAVHDALPDGRRVEFEGVGHSGPTEAPDRTAEAVRGFVDGVAPTPPRT